MKRLSLIAVVLLVCVGVVAFVVTRSAAGTDETSVVQDGADKTVEGQGETEVSGGEKVEPQEGKTEAEPEDVAEGEGVSGDEETADGEKTSEDKDAGKDEDVAEGEEPAEGDADGEEGPADEQQPERGVRGERGSRGGFSDEQRQKMMERYQNMSEEERKEMGDRMRGGRRSFGDGEDRQGSGRPGEGRSPGGDEGEADDGLVAVNLNNIEMKDVIKTIGDWTGKPIIPTSDEVLKQRITIYAAEKMSKNKALSLIYAALRTKGFIAEHSDDKIFIKPISQAKLGSIPTLGVADPLARFEDKSQVVEKFFQLVNYSPSKLAKVITPLTAEYGHVTAIENTGNIAVIDTVENLMRIERIISQLDVPESDQTIEKIFEIKNADPLEIVQVIQLIIDEGQASRSRGPQRPSGTPSKNAVKPASSVVIETTEIPVKLIPLPKQNWIIARGSADDIKTIEEWIDRLDIEESVEQQQSVLQVRFVDAREVASVVQRTLRSMPGNELRASVVVEALPQSKQIVVFGSEENRKMVERIVAEVDLPTDDIFIDKTFTLKHADPDQIKENVEELFVDDTMSYRSYGRYGSGSSSKSEDTVKIISYPTLSQVTVIASEGNMKKIAAQIAEWDVPLDIEKDQYRILSLKNSDPVQMVDLLTKLFSEDGSSSSSGGGNFMRMIMGGRGGSAVEDKKKIVGSLYGLLTFEPVPDTKKIIIISKVAEAYDVIERLVEQLDSQEIAEVPRVITLNYADAEDLSDQLNAILNEPGTTATIQRSDRGLAVDSDSFTDDSGQVTTNETDAGTITPWWNRQQRSDNEMPASNLIGNIRFIPVHRSKAILVLAPPEYMDAIEAMITELDQPGKQVMIKTAIISVDHSDMTSLGVQLAANQTAFGTLAENSLTALTALTNTGRMGSVGSSTTSANISTLIDLLVKKIDAKVLNQPTLWTKDNEEAVFAKGQEIAFIVADQSDSTNLNSLQRTFDYRDVGVTLRVRPNITPSRAVDVTIYLEVSTVEQELVNSQIATNKLDTTTHVIIEDGETIMLGGILFQTDSLIKRKVPLLGDIPLVGALFTHEKTEKTNNELLVFITPYVIDGEDTRPETREEMNSRKATFDAVTEHLGSLFEQDEE